MKMREKHFQIEDNPEFTLAVTKVDSKTVFGLMTIEMDDDRPSNAYITSF